MLRGISLDQDELIAMRAMDHLRVSEFGKKKTTVPSVENFDRLYS